MGLHVNSSPALPASAVFGYWPSLPPSAQASRSNPKTTFSGTLRLHKAGNIPSHQGSSLGVHLDQPGGLEGSRLENECQWSGAEGGTAGHGTDQTGKTVTKVSEAAQLGLETLSGWRGTSSQS